MSVVCFSMSEASVKIDIFARQVEVGVTSSLSVNCTFSYDVGTNVTNLASLVISHDLGVQINGTTFKDLASINIFTPDTVSVLTPMNVTTSGHIDTVTGVSSLSLRWDFPSANEVGQYRCTALGFDTTGHAVNITVTDTVSTFKPDLDQWIETVRNQQSELDDLRKAWATVDNSVSTLVTSLGPLTFRMSAIETSLQLMTDFMNDTLSNINGRLSTVEVYRSAAIIYDNEQSNEFYMSSEYKGKHYLLSSSVGINGHASQAKCILKGGYLAEIDEAEENDFIIDFLNTTTEGNTFLVLLGATDEDHDGVWEGRHSKRAMAFSDWYPGEPNNYTGYDCLFLYRNYNWQMYNSDCSYGNIYLCEVTLTSL